MTKRLPVRGGIPTKKRLWLLLLLVPAAGLLWKEYPALVRYIKIERM